MEIIRDIKTLRNTVNSYKQKNKTISFIPTMGALHNGHLSLIDTAKAQSDITIASIFVNPKQFAPNEDLDNYPRTEESDLALLDKKETSIAYIPQACDIYPENFVTSIHIGSQLHEGLCSKTRPHFFDGVAIIVLKLFMQVQPDIAIFGEKDYQQLCIIKQMVKDLDIPITIIGSPIVRETDGLAMSSRNKYLTDSERLKAPHLYKTLTRIVNLIRDNHHDVAHAIQWGKNQLHEYGLETDYIELRQSDTLIPLNTYKTDCRLIAAATLGKCRLLDNLAL